MSTLFTGVVVITGLLYFLFSSDFRQNRHIAERGVLAASAAVIAFVFMYISLYQMTPFNLLLWFSVNSMIALAVNSSITGYTAGQIMGVAMVIVIGFCWVAVITLLSIITASQLAAAPAVTTFNGPSDVINSSHIRLVSYETAQWRSDKVIGSLGYKSEIGDPDIQMLNGTLVWITPLDFSGVIKAWSYSGEGTGGYVIVNAEDPKPERR